MKKTLHSNARVYLTRIANKFPSVQRVTPRHIYFLVVGHTQFVGFLFPTQTLPWQNSIFPVDFTLPAVSFAYFIIDAFFLSMLKVLSFLFLL